MLYIFDMANNHMGDLNHAKKIVHDFSKLSKKWKINSGIKLQLRNLETFIHCDFKHRNDLKYIKRFKETELSQPQIKEIVDLIKNNNLLTIATPFDNESIDLINKFKIEIIKVASCSIDDWPLLEQISKINKKIIISTAGASIDLLKSVYDLFKKNKRDFVFMHCVGDYPTSCEFANLRRITDIKTKFADLEVGFSTHESPIKNSLVTYAIAMGCTVIEKHIGVETKKYKLNEYTMTVKQMDKLLSDISNFSKILNQKSKRQEQTLKSLKRGIYLKNNLLTGHRIEKKDIYFAMPIQKNALGTSDYYSILGSTLLYNKKINDPICLNDIKTDTEHENGILKEIKKQVKKYIKKIVTIREEDEIEISCPFGLNNFFKNGCVIISKINYLYCKKIIVLLPKQKHPPHKHAIKEESFELLHGDCLLTLNNKKINLEIGKPIQIKKQMYHSLYSKSGCVVEEISTKHYQDDSFYKNSQINNIEIQNRKIKIKL